MEEILNLNVLNKKLIFNEFHKRYTNVMMETDSDIMLDNLQYYI